MPADDATAASSPNADGSQPFNSWATVAAFSGANAAPAVHRRAWGAADKQSAAAADRRQRFLDHLLTGALVKDCVAFVGVTLGTYEKWRANHPDFKARVDTIMASRRSRDDPFDGTFSSFRLRFFGMHSFWHHMQMVDLLETADPMSVSMILAPPEHGKTSVVEDYICFKLALDPNHRITVVSEGQGHAKKIIGRVQRRMTDTIVYPDYIARFGPFYVEGQERKGKPWTTEYMTVFGADHDERDFSLEARGSTSAIAGTRVDTLIFDDIQSRRNLNRTNDLVETIRQDFLTRPGKTGRTVFIGTRVDVGDVYESLEDQGIVDRLVRLPATDHAYNAQGEIDATIVDCPRGDDCDVPEIPHEQPLCPEMWDTHSLAKRRKQVTDGPWWRNYQQRPQLAGDATFSEKMIDDAWDYKRRVAPPEEPGVLVALGLDPALGGGNAVVAAALHTAKLEVLDVHTASGLGTIQGVTAQVAHFALVFNPRIVVIETDTHQKGIARSEEMEALSRQYGFSVVEHRTSGEKADPILGVAMMAGGFGRGDITFPAADDYARRRMEPLVAELRSWRHDISAKKLKQDLVMALWFVWKYWMETRGRGSGVQTVGPRRGTPWQPTNFRPSNIGPGSVRAGHLRRVV